MCIHKHRCASNNVLGVNQEVPAPWIHDPADSGPQQHQVRARVQGLQNCVSFHL